MDELASRLRAAAEGRRLCRVRRGEGAWTPAAVVRPEAVGLVIDAPGHDLAVGEEVRLWLEDDGGALQLEGAVLRVAVTLPGRGTGGVLVGQLAEIEAEAPSPGLVLEVRMAGGGALSLVDPPVRIVEVTPSRVTFEVPRRFPIAFPERGLLRLRLGADGRETHARARVDHVVRGAARTLYAIEITDVDRRDVHEAVLAGLRGRS